MENMDLKPKNVSTEDILLDPNNPRFYDIDDREEPIPEDRYGRDSIQEDAKIKLKTRAMGKIDDLKRSIESNGYVSAELIVVREYGYEGGDYVVIEGNRRVAAIKDILSEEPMSDDEEDLHDSLENINVLVYEETGDEDIDDQNISILQGLRHVAGPKEWGAYQKANLVAELHDDLGNDFSEIDKRLGLGPKITIRYYRAYKALQQMMDDDEFGRLAEPDLFTIFEEAIRKPGIKDFLDWNDEEYIFESPKRREFYDLIVGDPEEDEEPRITNYNQVRDLGNMLADGKMTQVNSFLNGSIDIETAKQKAYPPDKVPLIEVLQDCVDALDKMETDETREMSEEVLSSMDQILDLIEQRKKDYEALQQAN